MAKAYDARCLVIKHTKLGETDMIVTLLADDGRQLRAVAKGLRKPGNRIGARLELFSEADLLLHEGRSLDIVREVKTVDGHSPLRESLESAAAAHVVAEMLEKLSRDGASLGERAYAMSSSAFTMLEGAPADSIALLCAAFLLKLMSMQGFAPAVKECALCGKPMESIETFDIGYGGALCAECTKAMNIGSFAYPHARAWMPSLLYCTFAELSEQEGYPVMELLDLSHTWVKEHAGFQLKSLTFLKSILG